MWRVTWLQPSIPLALQSCSILCISVDVMEDLGLCSHPVSLGQVHCAVGSCRGLEPMGLVQLLCSKRLRGLGQGS